MARALLRGGSDSRPFGGTPVVPTGSHDFSMKTVFLLVIPDSCAQAGTGDMEAWVTRGHGVQPWEVLDAQCGRRNPCTHFLGVVRESPAVEPWMYMVLYALRLD